MCKNNFKYGQFFLFDSNSAAGAGIAQALQFTLILKFMHFKLLWRFLLVVFKRFIAFFNKYNVCVVNLDLIRITVGNDALEVYG